MMMTQIDKQSYLGVRCLSCRQPIPLPSILVESVSAAAAEDSSFSYAQYNRVFSLRCRLCEREKPYRASEVVEFEGAPVARRSRAGLRGGSGQSGSLARSANA
jgi:hypothetical protein